jgi:hypothetical protein
MTVQPGTKNFPILGISLDLIRQVGFQARQQAVEGA